MWQPIGDQEEGIRSLPKSEKAKEFHSNNGNNGNTSHIQ